MEIFSGKISAKNPNVQRHLKTLPGHNNSGVSTLNAHVFSRDKYHPAKVLKVHHAVAVIPKSRQRNVYFKCPRRRTRTAGRPLARGGRPVRV